MNADDFVGGHSILALERFMDDTRHMIIFDVLSWKSPVGEKGERLRLFLSDAGYAKAQALAMTARSMSSPSPSVKRIGTGAILPTTGLGQTLCPSPPILTHGVLTATAIWPSTAIPVWSICFSVRLAKPTRRSGRKPLSGIS